MKLMSIYESILMTELAVERKRLEILLNNISDDILNHIFYIITFPHEKENVNHWKKEIVGKLLQLNIYRTKPNNKRLKKEIYFDLLYTGPVEPEEENFEKWIEIAMIKKEGLVSKENINIEGLIPLVRGFFDRVSKKLSDGTINKEFLDNELVNIIDFSLK